MSDLVGRRLGPYELHEVIAHGGMATVYKARQPSLERWVAVKVLTSPDDPEFVAWFQGEAQLLARLHHPDIVPLYDYGEQDGQRYQVLEYLEGGRSLAALTGTPMAPADALALVVLLLAALGYLHERGIVHCGVKPGNVLLPSPTWPVLTDFSIVRLLDGQRALYPAREGMIIGTAAYMAPEQAFNLPVDARTDLYATGVVLYQLLTGRAPFGAATPAATRAAGQRAADGAAEPDPELPAEVEAVLLRALAKPPEQRYQTAEEMTQAVQEALASRQRTAGAGSMGARAAAYAAGVRAFTEGRFDEVIVRLSPLAASDPGYEDVDQLLAAARAFLNMQPPIT